MSFRSGGENYKILRQACPEGTQVAFNKRTQRLEVA